MVNIDKRPKAPTLSSDERHFVDTFAALLAPWGMAPSTGRVYGYLLLHQAPISLDQIAAALQMSKVGAWKAARSLEEFGHVHRRGSPGSKRALYGPSDRFDTPIAKQSALLGSLGKLLRDNARIVENRDAAARLREISQFYLALRGAIETTIDELHERQAKKKR